ncbi:restriction endonuclease [Micromonospora sp. RTGN7]|uniref:restriction endonuclease n=1 Tax=Micromonospora sp. RTGN7 TaxID=3016526 RepID=UPI0029FF4C72|nr:restriction endonuclease [Micromonospora sp. RTGN7]
MIEDDYAVVRFPPAEITPARFEVFVAEELLRSAGPEVDDLVVTLHDKVTGPDGSYDLDATVRYRFAGLAFLVVVEAKLHRNPIKRELVQVLYQKVQSIGAHKGVMVATAPYQAGAVAFARAHGIALVTVVEGRFVFVRRTPGTVATPALVAYVEGGTGTGGMVLSAGDEDHAECVATWVLGRSLGADVDV